MSVNDPPLPQHVAAFRRWGSFGFVLTIMLSAALLFAMEPMFTRMLLPRFGGSAAVWSVAIVFFQTTLLLGYLYAHVLTRYLSPRLGALIHISLLFLGLLLLPIRVREAAWQAGLGQTGEEFRLIALFVTSIGLPFLALSANAPLLQAWFSRAPLPRAHDPYPLYAASNFGSLAALVAYPFIIEPLMPLGRQSVAWSLGYVILIGLVALAGLGIMGRGAAVERRAIRVPLPAGIYARWLGLALVPSAALVAVTAHLSTDVAAAPFLWVVPLALYLATFVFAFSAAGQGVLRWSALVLAPVLIVLAVAVGFEFRLGLLPDLALHLAGFWLLGIVCHGQLAASRPAIVNLTNFYLAMSLGGALGGILAALVAPRLFTFVAEYPLVLLLAALALPRGRFVVAPLVAAIFIAGVVFPRSVLTRETLRSFYGVHKIEVTRDGQYRVLRHGMEIHGAQQIADAAGQPLSGKPRPLTYYHDDSPISEAIDAVRVAQGGKPLALGVVGLGAGSIACLTEPGDRVDFYEIDPVIIRIAQDKARFSFLSSCAPQARIIEGDARQTLAQQRGGYDVLIIDAFSSDAIPAHLLTREAMKIYLDRLNPEGVVVFHLSNNHLRLNEVVAATAASLGLKVRIHDEYDDNTAPLHYQPTVAAVARSDTAMGDLARAEEWVVADRTPTLPWTDDYCNMFGALIAKMRED